MNELRGHERELMCSVEYDNWGDESNPKSDWYLMNKHATFAHRNACEFIFYIHDQLPDFFADMSDTFKKYYLEAKESGYKYILFYA